MKIPGLPAAIRDCACGMVHTCDIEHVEYGRGAIRALPALLAGYHRVLLVADDHTYAACGKKVELYLHESLHLRTLVLHREGVLIPDERAIDEVNACLTDDTDLILGVGSGVIQDLCKYTAFKADLPYAIVATAPSMDGYASVGAAMILGGMKVTVDARVPKYIIGDSEVLARAPMDMIRSGAGDILGKISCLNDWKISHIVNGEHFCQRVYDMVMAEVEKCKRDIDAYLSRSEDAVERLFVSLITVGIAMSYMTNSRPASGSEHHLAHFYEIVNILADRPYFPHGTDVAYGTVASAAMSHALAESDPATFTPLVRGDAWERDIDRVYTTIADSIRDLQKKTGFYDADRLPVIRERWDEIRAVLLNVPTAEEMAALVERLGLPLADYRKMYGKAMIADSLVYAKDLKNRYTLLWLLADTGTLHAIADRYLQFLFD